MRYFAYLHEQNFFIFLHLIEEGVCVGNTVDRQGRGETMGDMRG